MSNEHRPTRAFDSTAKAGAMVRRLGEVVLNEARELRAKYEGILRDLGEARSESEKQQQAKNQCEE